MCDEVWRVNALLTLLAALQGYLAHKKQAPPRTLQ